MWRIKRLIYEFLGSFLFSLEDKKILFLGRFLGHLMWILLPERRKISINHIKYHLGLKKKESISLAKKSFLHSGMSFLELFIKRKIDFESMALKIKVVSHDLIQELIDMPRPIVSVTAHIGAWELLGGMVSLAFWNRPCGIVVRHPKDLAFKEVLMRFRSSWNVNIISNKESAHEILSLLRKNGLVAFLVDQNCGKRWAIFLNFFKDYAAVNIGPALMALRSNALVWPVFLLREHDHYILKPYEPLDTLKLKGSIKEKVREIALFYTKSVEEMVKTYPEQWFWMHRRWKTRPPWEKKTKFYSF